MKNYFYAIIVIIVITLLYNIATWNTGAYEDYLYGFWAAEGDDFCEESEIDSMLIFIGEPDDGWTSRSRTCYIIIMNDLCNQGFTITYHTGWAGIGVGTYRVCANVEFDEENIWPEQVYIDVDMRDGTMKIHSDGTIYARLTKHHEISNICHSMENAELIG